MSELALQLIAENKKTKGVFLDLANCGLTEIPAEIAELEWLEGLSLSHYSSMHDHVYRMSKNKNAPNNDLCNISALASLSRLRSLEIEESNLNDLTPLANLIELRKLSLVINHICDLNPIKNLSNLEELHLSGNQVNDLSPLGNLKNLQKLSISGPLINNLSPLSSLVSLRSISINYTQISEIDSIANLTQLEEFSAAQNKCMDLSALKNFKRLRHLNLITQKNSNLSVIAGLPNLSSVTLWGCYAKDLKSLENLITLESLTLHSKTVKNLAFLSTLIGLKKLHIHCDNLVSLAPLANLTSLERLHISSSKVIDLLPISDLADLKILTVSHSKVADLSPLINMKNLVSLDVSNTEVTDLSPLTNLLQLKTLNASNTYVTDLSGISKMIENGSPVRWEEESWGKNGIYIKNCPLLAPPVEIANQGNDAILNYIKERSTGELDYLYEAKMLILGEGGAGKTSLLRRLYKQNHTLPCENETTKGIDIYRHEFKLKNGRSFRLNVWDFGGQEIYHATHQFFLTRRSLYLLLDDTRKDHKSVSDPGFKSWLDLIELFGEHSPVLIFQNEKGGRSKEIDISGIRGRYDNVKECYRGNLEYEDAVIHLRDGIELYVSQLSHIGEGLPASWIKIRADIETLSTVTPHISQQEYFDIYTKYLPFDKTKALFLSRYLHDLGVFLHFQDDPLLVRTVILQNPWATEAVYRMLDDESVKARSGRFDLNDCKRLWKDSDYAEMHPELLALMENFELCYSLPNTKSPNWLAPQLLSPVKPVNLMSWEKPEDLVLRYKYAFLPKGIIGRLMVRLHRFVPDPTLASVTCVLFEHENTFVLAQLLANGCEIELRARGSERKALLSVVAAELDAINNGFVGLRNKVGKWIPCNCQQCRNTLTPHLFEEKMLCKRAEDKRMLVECPISYEDMNVPALLDGVRIEELPSWSKGEKAMNATKKIKIFLASMVSGSSGAKSRATTLEPRASTFSVRMGANRSWMRP